MNEWFDDMNAPFQIVMYMVVVMVGLSLGEQNFIKGGIAQDLRTDGRKRLTYRPIFIETGIIPQVQWVWSMRYSLKRLVDYVFTDLFLLLERQVAQQE